MKHEHRFEILCLTCRTEMSFHSKDERAVWKREHKAGHGAADFVEWEADIARPQDQE